jgi:hypothetical protein
MKTDAQELRHFGLLLGLLVVIIFAGIPFLRRHMLVGWPWAIAAILWVAALIIPRVLTYPHRGWTRLGEVLAWINTRVILSVLYFVVLMPIGAIMRLVGHDPMQQKFDSARGSYRVASRQRRSSHLEQPF